jgi:uncharacterized protein YciI
MSEDLAQQVAALSTKLSREQCYLLMMKPNPDAPLDLPPRVSREQLRIRHHEYLVDLEQRGIIFGAGPFADIGEKPSGSGMIIVRAKNREEAARIGGQEPYTQAGLRVMDIIPWQRTEGSIRLELRLADGVLKIDERIYHLQKSDD